MGQCTNMKTPANPVELFMMPGLAELMMLALIGIIILGVPLAIIIVILKTKR